ncbi:MAG TPA: ATP-binding protein, partial [Cyclobacteriaceae bacterium]
LLAFAFLLPALFFSVYEISSLNREEKMIQEIYSKQLEAILFSVNQYSDDVLNSWISKIEAGLEEEHRPDSLPPKINTLLNFYSSITHIVVFDTLQQKPVHTVFSLHESDSYFVNTVDAVFKQNRLQIDKLISYKRSGFQKIDVIPNALPKKTPLHTLFFIREDQIEHLQVVGLIINAETFITDMIGPRLQVVAHDQFVLSAFKKGEANPVYSTLASDNTAVGAAAQTKDFWLFPDYTLGIRTKGSSLEAVTHERTTTNLFLLITLDVVLIMAVILVFRNVKKEVRLAQNKADFVSNVSHEIRTPLALISMFAETLELGRVKTEEKKQEYYGIISKETQRLTGIVNKILNFSQTEANKKTLTIEPVHVSTEIRKVLNTYDFHFTQKGFIHTLKGELDLMVMADREALVECLINLIDNAIKYSADKKQIEIMLESENGFGLIVVKDHGIGISSMDQKHIFDKFYRVSSGDLAKSRGTGLGLSLVKQLMEAQHGRVTVSGIPGKGSTFILYFPLYINH